MSDAFGFDKASRNRADEAAQAAQIPTSLNPEFPYIIEPFDPNFFGLKANPEPSASLTPSPP